MKSLNLQFGDNRQNQREDMFLANIVEKVQLGKIGLISFVDQAQFIDLMTQKYKKKTKVQPVFNKIYQTIQVNLAKHQQTQQKIQEVSYEIKTISSTRQLGYRGSFNISNKSGVLLVHKDSNLKEHQTIEFSDKEIQDQQILEEATKTEKNKRNLRLSQITSDKKEIKEIKTIKTSRDNIKDQLQKQDNISTARNEKLNYNLLTQEGSDNSLSQIKIESYQSCLIPSEKLRYGLNTNFTSEISNGQVQNQSATFNNQQEFNQQQPLTSRKQSDVLLKSIKGSYPKQAYLISQLENNQRKTLTPVSQSKIPQSFDQKQNDNQQQVNKNEKQEIIIKSKKGTLQQQQPYKQFKQKKKIQDEPQNSLNNAQKSVSNLVKPQLEQKINQETSFCGHIINSQRGTRKELDERQLESPQFVRTDVIEDMVITHTPQQSLPKQIRQGANYRSDSNALNKSDHSFQSKRYIMDQQEINSLIPPLSSRTLTSAQKDKIDQKNSISNNSETDQKQHKNQLTVNIKRGSKRMRSHNVQGNENEYDQQEEESIRRYSQERVFKNDNKFEKIEEDRYQYTINNLEQTGSSSSLNNYENENNNNQINIQVSRCDNREKIIEEESLDGSMRQHQTILFSTQDRMNLKIGDNSFHPQSSSRSVAKSITPNTPMGSVNTAQPSNNNSNVQNNQVQKKKKQSNQNKRPQLSTEYSQTKISMQKQKSEDSFYEKEYTNESSQEPERSSRLKPKKLQQKLQPPSNQIQQQRRKSSAQVSPMDPRKAEQQEKEKQKQIEYQKQIERMKLERDLMEQYKIPDGMPLPQKKQIIESLICELSNQHDQDVKYQVSLYNERQDQIQNIQKNYEEKIDFRYNIVNSCYNDMDYLCEHKLKLKQKDLEVQKIIHLKFQDQHYNNQSQQNQNGDKEEEEGSPYKKQSKMVFNFDPVEIENHLKRRCEFINETEFLKFLKLFQSEYNKKVYQCNLDHPIQDIRQEEDKQFTKGLIARNFKKKQTKNVASKIEINNYQMDMNKIQYVKEKAPKIQKLGLYLLMTS